jgi:hypothetical protein
MLVLHKIEPHWAVFVAQNVQLLTMILLVSKVLGPLKKKACPQATPLSYKITIRACGLIRAGYVK